MTVGELIVILQNFDSNKNVYVLIDDGLDDIGSPYEADIIRGGNMKADAPHSEKFVWETDKYDEGVVIT